MDASPEKLISITFRRDTTIVVYIIYFCYSFLYMGTYFSMLLLRNIHDTIARRKDVYWNDALVRKSIQEDVEKESRAFHAKITIERKLQSLRCSTASEEALRSSLPLRGAPVVFQGMNGWTLFYGE